MKGCKKILFFFAWAAGLFFLNACAASYKPIDPPGIKYTAYDSASGIEYFYQYDVLRKYGNRKIARKEYKNKIRVVAIKIVNHNDYAVTVNRNLLFYAGDKRIFPLEPQVIDIYIRQKPDRYLLYLLLSFINQYEYTDSGTRFYPVGIILGPVLAALNFSIAESANRNMENELNTYNIINRPINKEETVYGILGFMEDGYDPIRIIVSTH